MIEGWRPPAPAHAGTRGTRSLIHHSHPLEKHNLYHTSSWPVSTPRGGGVPLVVCAKGDTPSGWETAADEDNVGWGSGTYSNVAMTNGSLTLGEGCQISFGVADGALDALLSGNGGSFSMTIATGIGNGDYFGSDLLRQLADQTIFYVADEAGAAIANNAGLNAGDTLNTRISDLRYELVDNTQLCVTGVFWRDAPLVPEPATATLSLLALASLAARRRKR